MRRDDDPYRNVPADILEEVRKQEKDKASEEDGILGSKLTSDEGRSKPKPDGIKPARHNIPKRVTDIRSGHGYT